MEMNKYTKVVGNRFKELRCKLVDIISVPYYRVYNYVDVNKMSAEDLEALTDNLEDVKLVEDAGIKEKIAGIIRTKLAESYDRKQEFKSIIGDDTDDDTYDNPDNVDVDSIKISEYEYYHYLVFELPDKKQFIFSDLGEEYHYTERYDMNTVDKFFIEDIIKRYAKLIGFNPEDNSCVLRIHCNADGYENRSKDDHIDSMFRAIVHFCESRNIEMTRVDIFKNIASRIGCNFDDIMETYEDDRLLTHGFSIDNSNIGVRIQEDEDGNDLLPDHLLNIDSMLEYFNDKIVSFSIDHDDFCLCCMRLYDSVDEISDNLFYDIF